MMRHTNIRISLVVLEVFVALTALVGGLALLIGAFPAQWLPVEQLQGGTFSDYTVPALLLTIVVGGSSLLAAVTVFTGREVGVLASLAAGAILVGGVVVEGAMVDHMTFLQPFYFVLGLLIWTLAAGLWTAEMLQGQVHTYR
jgi:hypothetical protein